jgi:hypothetical protein
MWSTSANLSLTSRCSRKMQERRILALFAGFNEFYKNNKVLQMNDFVSFKKPAFLRFLLMENLHFRLH